MIAGNRAGVFTAAALWGAFDRQQLLESDPDWLVDQPLDTLALVPPA